MKTAGGFVFPRAALCLACFFFAAGLMALFLAQRLPFPQVPVVREKVEHLARHGNEYDVMFLGSSRTYFHVMPAVFDRVSAEQGRPVQSFNAGAAALVPPEDGYVLDQILRAPHARLRWLFVEIMPVSVVSDSSFAGTRRYSYWHDWERTHRLTACFFEDWAHPSWAVARHRTVDRGEFLGRWLQNLQLFGEHAANLGRGADLTAPRKEVNLKKLLGPRDSEGLWDGWSFPDKDPPLSGQKLTDYEAALASLQQSSDRYDPGSPISWEELQTKLRKLSRAGITPILVVPPTVVPRRYLPSQLAGTSVAVWDYSDPHAFPELFSVDHRLDGVHLNKAGAEVFSAGLAKRFAAFVGGKGESR